MATLVERLMASRIGKDFVEEEAAELLERRRFLVGEIARLVASHEAELPGLVKAEEQTLAKVRASEDALRAVQVTHNAAVVARMTRANHFDSATGPLVGELRASASPTIDAFIKELHNLHERMRKQEPSSPPLRPFSAFPDPADAKAADERNKQWTNRLARIRAAIPEAEALKLEALDSKELEARLASLRHSVGEEGK